MDENALSHEIIGIAIEVHRNLGPGLLESVYEEGMAYEMSARKMPFERQIPIPVRYKDVFLECGFRMDLWVAPLVVVEIKAVERMIPLYDAQLMTYLKLTGCKLGLLLNFNTVVLRDGIKRIVLGL